MKDGNLSLMLRFFCAQKTQLEIWRFQLEFCGSQLEKWQSWLE